MNQPVNFTDVKTKVYKAEGEKNPCFFFFQLSASQIGLEIKILLPQPPEYKVIGPLTPYFAP